MRIHISHAYIYKVSYVIPALSAAALFMSVISGWFLISGCAGPLWGLWSTGSGDCGVFQGPGTWCGTSRHPMCDTTSSYVHGNPYKDLTERLQRAMWYAEQISISRRLGIVLKLPKSSAKCHYSRSLLTNWDPEMPVMCCQIFVFQPTDLSSDTVCKWLSHSN